MNKSRGITLVALVITIIVMLILVGVSITVAINGGLFGTAQDAARRTEEKKAEEQRLANGKVKIGGQWYATMDDYINNNPITTGIEINPAEITLKQKEVPQVAGTEILEAQITASTYGMEQAPTITWETADTEGATITISATEGNQITVTAVTNAEETGENPITVTAKCTYEGIEYQETCIVNLEKIRPLVARGDFVEYDVAYTDVYYNTYTYTNKNGWRLLNYDLSEDGQTITNVEIISTGMPAKLYYKYTISADWWDGSTEGIATFRTALKNYWDGTTDYPLYNNNDLTSVNLKGAAGMYNNFASISFVEGEPGVSQGGYTAITTGGRAVTGPTTGENLFLITGTADKVRMLTLPEINKTRGSVEASNINSVGIISTEPAPGIFILNRLKNIASLSTYKYTSGSYYWLASPYSGHAGRVHIVDYSGSISYSYDYAGGVRLAVSLRSDIHYSVEKETEGTHTYLVLTEAPAE